MEVEVLEVLHMEVVKVVVAVRCKEVEMNGTGEVANAMEGEGVKGSDKWVEEVNWVVVVENIEEGEEMGTMGEGNMD
ncbi:hypothetical protein HPP92_023739 [Vanilla planifolia]|uniref:Uncharacterized protein n=1 Tax=Vanilla planifolia TaxID=51239 RepID=A0A835UE19_VANPL|nr:hypothetical protein HPP92_023739 [Vanilla planifolia]